MHRILVTVGSTFFDPLIAAVTCDSFLRLCSTLGFTHMTLQIGSGKIPVLPTETPIKLECLTFTNDLRALMLSADVIICHAGAGTLLEAMRLPPPPGNNSTRRTIITVVNESLMDNHQHELASQLSAMGFIRNSTLHNLSVALRQSAAASKVSVNHNDADPEGWLKSPPPLTRFPSRNDTFLPFLLDAEMGFSPSS